MKKIIFVLVLVLIPSFVFAGEKVYTDADLLKYSAKPMIDDESLQNREAGQAKWKKEQAQKETENNLKPKSGIIYTNIKQCSSSPQKSFLVPISQTSQNQKNTKKRQEKIKQYQKTTKEYQESGKQYQKIVKEYQESVKQYQENIRRANESINQTNNQSQHSSKPSAPRTNNTQDNKTPPKASSYKPYLDGPYQEYYTPKPYGKGNPYP